MALGDAAIENNGIGLATTSYNAGAVSSIVFRGRQFIDSTDHGREQQTCAFFDLATVGESINPTEAGCFADGVNPAPSTSVCEGIVVERGLEAGSSNNVVKTQTNLAFWLPVNGKKLSGDRINKRVTIGIFGLRQVMEHAVTYTIAQGTVHQTVLFEAVTGYMPEIFSVFYSLDPRANVLTHAPDDDPATLNPTKTLPLIFATPDGQYAMGVLCPDGAKYACYGFTPADHVVNWAVCFSYVAPLAPAYAFRAYTAVGTLNEVRANLLALNQLLLP